MTLFPGDIIATGTPSGVGQLEAGDIVEVEIEGIGILKNKVFLEKEWLKTLIYVIYLRRYIKDINAKNN